VIDFHTENTPVSSKHEHRPANDANGTPLTPPQTSIRTHRAKARRVRSNVQRSRQPPRTIGDQPRLGHTARFRREHRTPRRIPTVNAHRYGLTQTTRDFQARSQTRRGARNDTEHRQSRQFYLFRPLWFHVLLNSLFKVLCNFPSRYLFAIGIVAIFSLRCGIPPALSCTLKQLDSKTLPTDAYTQHLLTRRTGRIMRWAFPCSLAVTDGILVSFFSSAY